MEQSTSQNCNPQIELESAVTLSLEKLSQLRNPRLSVRIISDGEEHSSQMHKSINHHLPLPGIEYDMDDISTTKNDSNCTNCRKCDSLRQMLFVRDKTIMKLAEDRDEMKIKLTKTMNMNIELTRQLMKYHTLSNDAKMQNFRNENIANSLSNRNEFRSKSPIMNQLKDEIAILRRKCDELDGLYDAFKHSSIHSLRGAFNDLVTISNNKVPNTNQDCHCETEAELSSTSSLGQHNFCKDLPDEDHNNNSSKNRNQFQRTSSPIEDLKTERGASTKEMPSMSDSQNEQIEESVRLSSFDIWYNS